MFYLSAGVVNPFTAEHAVNRFYWDIKLFLLGTKYVSKHHDLKVFGFNLNK